jgi:hypothetical protein
VGPLSPAKLVAVDKSDSLDFHYNPNTLTITKTAEWKAGQARRGSRTAPPPEFIGTNARSLSLTLLFDAVEGPGPDVRHCVDTLLGWTNATEESFRNNKPQPPLLHLDWGGNKYFPGYLKSVTARYTVFSPKGLPLRASVDVVLEETPEDAKSQNPTSGGVAGRRAVTVGAGDSLQSLARQEYGDPNLWRALAAANGIDDPLRVPRGARLLVPPAAEAAKLAGVGHD